MLVMYLCRYRDAAKNMKAAGIGKIVEQYLTASSHTLRVYAIIGVGFIYGFGRSSRAILKERNDACEEFVGVFKTTLEAKSQV